MSINADWEKFLGAPNTPSLTRFHITIGRGGRITFNPTVFTRLGKPEAVCLFFNRRESKIALQPASPRFTEAFPIRSCAYGKIYYVAAATFVNHYGVRITQTHKFNRPEIAADGKLILNLNDTTVVSRPRKKSSPPGP